MHGEKSIFLLIFIALLLFGCGGNDTGPISNNLDLQSQVQETATTLPAGLPTDFAQPWEELDENGRVIAAVNIDSEFMPGVERSIESASGTADNGEAVRVTSGDSGSGTVSWVMYRVLMGGQQPGVVSVDANVGAQSDGSPSEYHIGLANYGENRWDWYGPFTDSHVRLGTDAAGGGDYLTDLGNHFVCVAAFDGAMVDVIGIGTNPYDGADSEAPPVPAGLYAIPTTGGLDINWDDVIAGDLAGYRLYYGDADFTSVDEAGVQRVGYLLGRGNHLLTGISAETYVRVSAVDISGNESALCTAVNATPLPGSGPDLRLGTSAVSGLINDTVTLTATGAVNYAWDLDGDGVYEVTGDTTGIQNADTGSTGILRPNVRGTTEDGSCVSLAAVSLIVSGNSRPVANAYATPTQGTAPHNVTLIGGGVDDDGTIVSWSWDFDGDGVFDQTDAIDPGPFAREYATAGLYNTKFRVEDDQGSWDIDTIAILVNPPGSGANNPPVADLVVGTGEEAGDAPHLVNLDASASTDPDEGGGDSIVEYHWDFDGDGLYDGTTDIPTFRYTYNEPGIFTAKVKVEDSHGDTDTATVEITVSVAGNADPVAVLTALSLAGDAPFATTMDATGSSDSDGTIVRYDWDFDNDGNYELYDGGASPDWTFTDPYYYDVTVRVTDDMGAQDTDTATITARGWWRQTWGESDPDDAIGMAVVNGKPALACEIDESPNGTQYFSATDPMGFGWNDPIKPAANSRYNRVLLEVVNGNPALVYMGNSASVPGDTTWHYVRATDADGTTWGTPVELSTDPDEYSPSIAIVDGNPAVVFDWSDWPDNELHYYRAIDANGTTWGTPVTVITEAHGIGIYDGHAMFVADGNPAIIYHDDDIESLRYIRATDATGNTWGTPVTIVTLADPADSAREAMPGIVDGKPFCVFEYYDDSSSGPYYEDIMVVSATDAAGTTWGSPSLVVAGHDISDAGNLAVIDGFPAFCFEHDDFDCAAYCRALDATGTTWGPIELVDTWWTCYDDTALIEVAGHPAVAYQKTIENDNRNGQLTYAIKIE